MNDGPEWEALLESREQCDVISFSHFLPNQVGLLACLRPVLP